MSVQIRPQMRVQICPQMSVQIRPQISVQIGLQVSVQIGPQMSVEICQSRPEWSMYSTAPTRQPAPSLTLSTSPTMKGMPACVHGMRSSSCGE